MAEGLYLGWRLRHPWGLLAYVLDKLVPAPWLVSHL